MEDFIFMDARIDLTENMDFSRDDRFSIDRDYEYAQEDFYDFVNVKFHKNLFEYYHERVSNNPNRKEKIIRFIKYKSEPIVNDMISFCDFVRYKPRSITREKEFNANYDTNNIKFYYTSSNHSFKVSSFTEISNQFSDDSWSLYKSGDKWLMNNNTLIINSSEDISPKEEFKNFVSSSLKGVIIAGFNSLKNFVSCGKEATFGSYAMIFDPDDWDISDVLRLEVERLRNIINVTESPVHITATSNHIGGWTLRWR